jgi:hypothetical protein
LGRMMWLPRQALLDEDIVRCIFRAYANGMQSGN